MFKKIVEKIKYRTCFKNYNKVLTSLRDKYQVEPLKVVFLNSELSKWVYQSLYEALENNPKFEVLILLTVRKSFLKKKYEFLNYKKLLKDAYLYFKNKGMNVEYGFDTEKKRYILLKNFKPDIVFYEQAGDVDNSQNVYAVSNKALTYYCSYGSSTTNGKNEYDLGFLKHVFKYYLDNNFTKDFLVKHGFKREQLEVSGSLKLDAYKKEIDLSNQIWKTNDRKRIIWAPHHSFFKGSTLSFGTFDWNYKFFFNYIKNHPEIEFIVKPHPDLKRQIVRNELMSREEVKCYFEELDNLPNSQVFEGSGYIDMFRCSDMLITDCNSFLSEYLPANKPVIHLLNKDSVGFNDYGEKIISGYYKAENTSDIEKLIDDIIIRNNDYLKATRTDVIKNYLILPKNGVANYIVNDIENLIKGQS